MISSTMRRLMHMSSRWVMSSCPLFSPPFHAGTIGICFHFLSVFPPWFRPTCGRRETRRSNRGTALEDKHPSLGVRLKQICLTYPIVFVVRILITSEKKIQTSLLFRLIFCKSQFLEPQPLCNRSICLVVFFCFFFCYCFTQWEDFSTDVCWMERGCKFCEPTKIHRADKHRSILPVRFYLLWRG